jgi:hypothetical protein
MIPKITINIGGLIQRHRIGEPLNDFELISLAKRTGEVANLLFGMGDLFHLAAKEAIDIFMSCSDKAYHRGLVALENKYNVDAFSNWLLTNSNPSYNLP